MRPRGERGATAVLVSLLVALVLLLSAAFAVDLGMQKVARRDMQALSDVVALDLARELDGRTKAQLTDAGVMDAAMDASVARNDDTAGDDPGVTWELGEVDADGSFRTVGDADVPNAVRVTSGTDVGFAFGGITGVDEGGAQRTAVATADESACIRVGSFVASLDSAESALLNPILGALLGSNVALDLVSYKGLANANVSLLDLVEVGGLEVGTVDELLALDNLSVAKLFVAAAKVLDKQGKGAEANLLRAITVSAGTPTIAVADLLEASPSSSAALGASLNVLDLVTGAAFLANEGHAVNVPSLGISLPGVATTTTRLTVIEAPRTKCGRVGFELETAQVRLDLTAHIDARTLDVSALGTSVRLDPTDVVLSLDLGQAVAQLRRVTCSGSGPDSLTVALRSAVLGALSVSASTGVHARVDPAGGLLSDILSLLNLASLLKPPYLTLDATVRTSAGSSAGSGFDKTLTLPLPSAYTTPVGSGSGIILGSPQVKPDVGTDLVLHYWDGFLLSGSWKERHLTDPVNAVFKDVLNPLAAQLQSAVVAPLLSTLQTSVVAPLAKLLGLQLGGADVFAVPTPSCAEPKLVG